MLNEQACKAFAYLCEAITEASTAMNLITGHPGGSQVVKKLHSSMALGHDLEYQEIPKISWNDLKGSYRGAWVIIKGTNGTGAIKASGGTTGSYDVVASDGGEVKQMSDSRGGNVLDFLKQEIGKPTTYFTARNTNKVQDTRRQRQDRNQGVGPQTTNVETLVKKFKPLWTRALSAAIADIKGHISNQIKNDAFEKARRKIERVEKLQNSLENLEAGNIDSSGPDSIKSSVNVAIMMAASHYYPDETGEIRRSYGGYNPERSEGVNKLLQDISKGDTKKLGTVLGFFKRTLISG